MKLPLALMLAAGLGLLPASAADAWRTLQDGEGTTIKVRFEGLRDDRFLLRRQDDGKLFEVDPGLLQEDDRAFFQSAATKLAGEIGRLSEASGHQLFTGTPFDGREAEEVARSLELRPESKTRHSSSWRSYSGAKYRLFGARPYSVALYADSGGRPTVLSAVYSNKGDFGSGAGAGEDHFTGGSEADASSLAAAMARDEKTIETAISAVLGPPATQRFGERATRRTVRRWDWNGHSLLLSSEDGEYVSLSIVPLEIAAGEGRTAKVADTALKQRLREDVVRETNGDVYLGQVPMVDQGPKGYCVPATFERAMRTMGLEADMYLLAMVGETAMGGGTSVERLLENIRSQVRSKGRRTKDESVKKLRIRDVKRYIDEGVPVMWTMRSLPEYNKVANEDTRARTSITDWTAWGAKITADTAELVKQERIEANHHICMIVGYNETTGELAVSDSWGARYERRWVPVQVADWASSGGLFLILP